MASPIGARAQQPKLPIVGFLGSGTPANQGLSSSAFAQRLRELGWIEGRTFALEYRWTEGRSERYAEFAAEFVRLKVDVIFTTGTPAAVAAKRATSLTPIVFAGAANPVGGGLVASLGRPGGDLTGLSSQNAEVASKQLELLREAIPSLHRLAVLVNMGNSAVVQELDEIQAAARALGLTVAPLEIRRADDILPAFEAIEHRADALYVPMDGLTISQRVHINTSALVARLPTMHGIRAQLEGGGLMSYGANTLGPVPARGRLRRQDTARREARRHPSRATDQVRPRHQPHYRQGPWPYRATHAARPRRRGDRMKTARVHHAARRRGGGVAARGARASRSNRYGGSAC